MGWLKKVFSKKEDVPMKRVPYSSDIKVNSNKIVEVGNLVERYKATRERYEVVSKASGVPADVIFAIHVRESSLSFKSCLHNGDPLNKVTVHVPKGRGPFATWELAAIDALLMEKHKFPSEWDIVGKLNFCEAYNGMGYSKRNVPSPYVLSWTNGYNKGKYVADGKYDPNFVDQQCGTAAIILGIAGNV